MKKTTNLGKKYLGGIALTCLLFSGVNCQPLKAQSNNKNITTQVYNKNQLPPNSNRAIPVKIGVFIINFAGIDEPNETYQIIGYLSASWIDKRLAFDPRKTGQSIKVFHSKDEIWHPDVEIFNQSGKTQSDRISIKVEPDGTVTYMESFNTSVSSGLQLKHFPFDKQRLRLIIDSFQYNNNQVVFIADSDKIGINREPFVSLSEWNIKNVIFEENEQFFPQDKQFYSRLNIYFNIERNYEYYIWKIIIPTILLLSVSYACFWIEIEDVSTTISIGLTNLLTAIMFGLTISGALPKVCYLTFLDGFLGIIYLLILSVIVSSVFLYNLSLKGEKEQELAQKIHESGKQFLPLVFFTGNLLLIAILIV